MCFFMSRFSEQRVLHCAETIRGGIATYLRDLIPLQAAEYGAENIAVLIPRSQVNELPVPAGVAVHTFADNAGRALNAIRLASNVISVVRRCRPSVVHVHSTFAGAAVRPVLASLFIPVRVIYCPHGWAWDRSLGPLQRGAIRAVERVLARFCAVIVCISEHERKTALDAGLPADRLVIVRNGVPSKPLAEAKPHSETRERTRISFIGRFDRQKGLDILLRSLSELGEQVEAVIAGAAVLRDDHSIVTSDNLSVLGWQTPAQIEDILARSDVLVVPSRWEGFGLVAVEAMRAGVAVVASRVGGLQEVVLDGVTGLLVTPGSVSELTSALASRTVVEWRGMGLAGRCRFELLFTIDRVHRELCSIYEAVPEAEPNLVDR